VARVEMIKAVFWMGSSRADLKSFPEPVQSDVGYALFAAQRGEEYRSVKSLQGFGGGGVLEIVVPCDGDAFRAVCRVGFKDSIYVLHAFQKKST
jgi:phage-related protein